MVTAARVEPRIPLESRIILQPFRQNTSIPDEFSVVFHSIWPCFSVFISIWKRGRENEAHSRVLSEEPFVFREHWKVEAFFFFGGSPFTHLRVVDVCVCEEAHSW